MCQITEIALSKTTSGVFTRTEVDRWVAGTPDRQFGVLRRALVSGEVVRIHRGLYCLAARYLRQKVNPLSLAQRIYGPSYISLETALSYHGWIPEAVYSITSCSLDRSREFSTPVGQFSFTRIPQQTFYSDVTRVETDPSGSFLVASPLKALTDYVYAHKCDWDSARPALESLRIDEASLSTLSAASIGELAANYSSRRVGRFLKGLQKEVPS